MSHRASLFGRGYLDHHLDSPRVRFRRAIALSAMTIVVPGSAQLAMGSKRIGRVALAGWLLVLTTVAIVVYVALFHRGTALSLATDVIVLGVLRAALIVIGILWLLLFANAWRLGLRTPLRRGHVALLTTFNSVVSVAAIMAVFLATQVVDAPRQVVRDVFTATETSAPQQGRYNVLLLGSDSGKDRTGLRPDSMTVLSVDRATGKSALISLPRNLQNVPFGEDSPMRQLYPDGFNCADCLLNAVYTTAAGRPDLFPGDPEPGMTATIDAVEEVTGLHINYHILINMRGFDRLVDAVGGIDINVQDRISIDGVIGPPKGWIEPGLQNLDGYHALWFARSRTGSDDYVRMGRQKCVMSAMVQQLSPQTVLFNAQKLADSSKQMLQTDIPASELDLFIDLALKTRGTKVVTTSFVPPVINTGNPDFAKIRELVDKAIAKSEGRAKASKPGGSESDDPQTETDGPRQRANAANTSDDLAASC